MGANAPAIAAATSPATNPKGFTGSKANAAAISTPANAHFNAANAKKRVAPARVSPPARREAASANAAFGAATATPPDSADSASAAPSNIAAALTAATTPNCVATTRHDSGARRNRSKAAAHIHPSPRQCGASAAHGASIDHPLCPAWDQATRGAGIIRWAAADEKRVCGITRRGMPWAGKAHLALTLGIRAVQVPAPGRTHLRRHLDYYNHREPRRSHLASQESC